MDELKDKNAGDASDASEDEASSGKKSRLSKRTIIMALSGFIALALIIASAFAYRSHVQQQEIATAQKKEQLAREAAALEQAREVAKAAGMESRRAHEAVMAASPPAAELVPPPAGGAETQDQAKQAETTKGDEVAAKHPRDEPVKATSEAAAGKEPKPAKTLEVSSPSAAGGCTVTGDRAEDYGKALGRCLEEFNRLEGRKP